MAEQHTLADRVGKMLDFALANPHQWITDMANTIEDSGWHREANVLVHTTMVVEEFLARWRAESSLNSREHYAMAIAAMFHDFGKPAAEETRISDEGKEYRRYAGHEGISAGMFWYATTALDDSGQKTLWCCLFGHECDLTPRERVFVAFAIEHHLPYKYGTDILNNVKATLAATGPLAREAFCMLLRSDCWGRISDGHDQKKADVEYWISKHLSEPYQLHHNIDQPSKVALVLVGPSGSGKTTYCSSLGRSVDRSVDIFSMDDLRLEMFGDDELAATDPVLNAEKAFRASCKSENSELFNQAVTQKITAVVRKGNNLIASDNTNLSRKSRRQFVAAARQKGYHVRAVLLSTPIPEILRRNGSRMDHQLPLATLEQMIKRIQIPMFGEFDSVIVI